MRLRIALIVWLLLTVSEAQDSLFAAEPGLTPRIIPVRPLPSSQREIFTEMRAAATGVTFTNSLALERYTTNQMLLNGSGIAAGDFDGDGRTDIFFAALDHPNALYRNLGGWRFENITETAGVAAPGADCVGALAADLDNDGDLDIAVTTLLQGMLYFVNDGKGRFTEQAAAAGFVTQRAGTSLAAADFDGDGDLDVYVAMYRGVTLRDQPQTNFRVEVVNGAPTIRTVNGRPANAPDLEGRFTISPNRGVIEHGEPDLFFVNLGANRFQKHEVAGPLFLNEDGSPFQKQNSWGLSVLFRDLNGDLLPDLYICNDFDSPDFYFINKGGRFQAAPKRAFRNTPKFSMGVDAADINLDGHTDIFAVDMLSRSHAMRLTRGSRISDLAPVGDTDSRVQVVRNTLQLNRGDGTYSDVANFARVDASEWSWTPAFVDVDLDGFEDLLITHGYVRDDMHVDHARRNEALRRQGKLSTRELLDFRTNTPPVIGGLIASKNNGDLTFSDQSEAWGLSARGFLQGLCLADLDNDGDMDLVVGRINDAPLLYQNNGVANRIAVTLRGQVNKFGVGARVTVKRGAQRPPLAQVIMTGGRFLSSDQLIRSFAAQAEGNVVEVNWPSGARSVANNVPGNSIIEFTEPAEKSAGSTLTNAAPPLFTDASALLNHRHAESDFIDYDRQPLLPYKLSQAGPGVSWADLNADGWMDALIPAGAGGFFGALVNKEGKAFEPSASVHLPAARDQNSVLALQTGDGLELIVAVDNYETGGSSALRILNTRSGASTELPLATSIGALAATDIDGDGVLELFVGGRVIPGRYPLPASSTILKRADGKWQVEAGFTEPLASLGMVAAACWSDLNGDGFPELIAATELGPLQVFKNLKGVLQLSQPVPGLADKRGWWRSVTTADVNRDGRMDIIAGNWGRNTRYESFRTQPIRFYYAADPIAPVAFFEAVFEAKKNRFAPWFALGQFRAINPDLTQQFRSYQEFAEADIALLSANWKPKPEFVEVNTLETMLFLNEGNRFAARPMPAEAQFAPVSGISAADFNGDGFEDLFLGQNIFCTHPENPRLDSGRGVILQGDGAGTFRALSPTESGVNLFGEQRGSAIADFDHDGRPDLLVAQNGAETKLLRNSSSASGFSVALEGPASNPATLGATVMLMRGDATVVTREVRAGAGYLSQDAARVTFPRADGANRIVVIWPGGKRSEHSATGSDLRLKAP